MMVPPLRPVAQSPNQLVKISLREKSLADQLRAGPLQPDWAFSIAEQIGHELSAARSLGGFVAMSTLTASSHSDSRKVHASNHRFLDRNPPHPTTQVNSGLNSGAGRLDDRDRYLCGFGQILAGLAAAVTEPQISGALEESQVQHCLDLQPHQQFASVDDVSDELFQIPPDARAGVLLQCLPPRMATRDAGAIFSFCSGWGRAPSGSVESTSMRVRLEREIALRACS